MNSGIDEVVPDSEEERLLQLALRNSQRDVIEISSDDDEFALSTLRRNTGTKFKIPRARRVVLSSSSEASDSEQQIQNDIIDLCNSPPKRAIPSPKTGRSRSPTVPTPQSFQSLYADGDDSDLDDGSILVLNEPKNARKPIVLRGLRPLEKPKDLFKAKMPTHTDFPSLKNSDSHTPTPLSRSVSPASSASPSRGPKSTSKKSQKIAEQEKRKRYAQQLFDELNLSVFKNGLPANTKLTWNARLLSTAGRAKWHRNRDGVETSEIELATKILDCNERIRNTLSHEMCHLASWTINKNQKEGHGKIWKTWAASVMKTRRDIQITTKHNYEITYPYEWRCEGCSKIYGRFSKSIKPDECVCGSCKVGKLIPMFTSRLPKTPKTNANSKLASGRIRDSPLSALDLSNKAHLTMPGAFPDSSDSDIELIGSGLTTLKI